MASADAGQVSLSDRELLSRARAGGADSEEALGILCARYFPLCRRLARQYAPSPADADDFVQEGTLGLIEAVRRYDESRGSSFESYVRRCVSSKLLSALEAMHTFKRRANVGCLPLENQPELLSPAPETRMIEQEDFRRRSRQILSRLSRSEHEVLRLYLRGQSYAQIAVQLDISQKSVDNALGRVRRKLRSALRNP